MMMLRMIVLLLFSCCVQTQIHRGPKVDNAQMKKLEKRLKTIEDMMMEQKSELEKKVQSLQDELEARKMKEQSLQDELEALKNESEVRKVAFSASLSATENRRHYGPHASVKSPLVYKKVFTNFGNGYNSDTGIFTAPVKGVYYFRYFALGHKSYRVAVSLFKNGKSQCSVWDWSKSIGNGSNGIVLTLEKGDQIFMRLWDNAWVYDDPAGYTSFGGFLLFPL